MGILAHAKIYAPGSEPSSWMLVLHGIFGMGTNFRGIAKTLAEAAPEWGFVLVDLRGHGASQGLPPPHDLAAAASDLDELARGLGIEVRGVMGHSFGGKVALAFAERLAVDVLCVLDSNPGARSAAPEDSAEGAASVLAALEALPASFESREAFQRLLGEQGYSRSIIDWLAMNVRRRQDAYVLRLDLPAIRSMLEDYFAKDLWAVLERPGRARKAKLVIAGRSSALDSGARARAHEAVSKNPALSIVELPNAGHWIHVDDPEGVVQAILDALRGQ